MPVDVAPLVTMILEAKVVMAHIPTARQALCKITHCTMSTTSLQMADSNEICRMREPVR
jgi:hypothetical protein